MSDAKKRQREQEEDDVIKMALAQDAAEKNARKAQRGGLVADKGKTLQEIEVRGSGIERSSAQSIFELSMTAIQTLCARSGLP